MPDAVFGSVPGADVCGVEVAVETEAFALDRQGKLKRGRLFWITERPAGGLMYSVKCSCGCGADVHAYAVLRTDSKALDPLKGLARRERAAEILKAS